jgi:hypothetical protein
LIPLQGKREPVVTKVKIISINTQGAPFWNRGFTTRYVALGEAISYLNPDVVQCQEVFTWRHWSLLRRSMPGLPNVGSLPSAMGPKGGLATFSVETLENYDYVRFRRPAAAALSALPLRTRLTLGLHGVLLTLHKPTGVLLLNVHTSANSAGDWSMSNRFAGMHRAQLSQLAKLINTRNGPVLVSGDFNTAAESIFYREFREQVNVIDVFEKDGHPTFRPEFLPANRSPRRIDYVFVAGSPSLRIAEAVHVLNEQPALSDHYGLQVIIEF